MTRRWWLLFAATALAALTGCGEGEKSDGTPTKQVEPAEAAAAKWQDWTTVALRNGLVTAQIVPTLGGRVMAFEFDGRNLLYANPKLLGQAPPAAGAEAPNFGGMTALAADVSSTKLALGTYAATIDRERGQEAVVKLASERDEAAGLTLTRDLTLARGGTVLRLTHNLTNVGTASRSTYLADTSQHPGSLQDGETHNALLQLILPLAAKSPLANGYKVVSGEAGEQLAAADGRLTLKYGGAELLVGADDDDGWVAWFDQQHKTVLAKFTTPTTGTRYADDQSATLYAAPAKKESYVAATLRSPLTEIAAGGKLGLEVCYAATHCPGPVVSVTPAGVVCVPLSGERGEQTVTLGGVFGVFYTGFAQVVFLNKDGAELARTSPVAVNPLTEYRLNQPAALPDGATQASLVLLTADRVQIGELDRCLVSELKIKKPEDVAVGDKKPASTATNAPTASTAPAEPSKP